MDYDISTFWIVILIIAALWDLAWRSMALWISAHKKQKVWFGFLLVVNSVGILPIIYLLLNSKRQDNGKD